MIAVSSLEAGVGARIEGLEPNCKPDHQTAEQLAEEWNRYGLLLFSGEQVSDELQIAISRCFGELEKHPLKAIRHPEFPELMVLSSEDKVRSPVAYYGGKPKVGKLPWHKDLIYTTTPNRGAVLKAVIMPPDDGATGFADLELAYSELPDSLKKDIENLEVLYRFGVDLGSMEFLRKYQFSPGKNSPRKSGDVDFPDFPDVVYPLVLTHPVTGRKILNISPMFLEHIPGMPGDQSRELLWELVDHVCNERYHYIHSWKLGEMILWDNWRYMHCALGHAPDQQRRIHRTTIVGGKELGRVVH